MPHHLAAIVTSFMIVAPMTNTSNWLILWHSTRHDGFQSVAVGFLNGGVLIVPR
ncbi:hypothetical protein PAMP_009056 [Pampus punctatissimus]